MSLSKTCVRRRYLLGGHLYWGRSSIEPGRWLPRAGRGFAELFAAGRYVGVCR